MQGRSGLVARGRSLPAPPSRSGRRPSCPALVPDPRPPPARPPARARLPCPQVRGTSSSVEELAYILGHSDSSGLVVQDAATLDRLLPALPPLRFVVLLWGEPSAQAAAALGPALHTFGAVLARGEAAPLRPVQARGGGCEAPRPASRPGAGWPHS